MALCGLCCAVWSAGAEPGGPTLRDLAPAQVYAVQGVSVDAPVALPAPGTPGPTLQAASAAADLDLFSFPNLGQQRDVPHEHTGLHWPAKRSVASPDDAQLFSVPGQGGWTLGTDNWRYTGVAGLGVTLGSGLSQAPAWSTPVRLTGVGLNWDPDAGASSNAWQYAMSVGAIDETPETATQGGLTYGPAASTSVLRYVVAPDVAVNTQAQWASGLSNVGLGGMYSLHNWGAWDLGISRAESTGQSGWGYQLGYSVDVFRDLRLSWVNQQRGAGYTDLSLLQSPLVGASQRNQWQATVPLGRWGDLTGTYAQLDDATGMVQQTVGVSQQFWYDPHVQVSVQANRDIVSGNYDLGVTFSLPID